MGEDFRRDSNAFIADDEREGRAEVGLGKGGGGVFRGGDEPDSLSLEGLQIARKVIGTGDGEVVDSPRA